MLSLYILSSDLWIVQKVTITYKPPLGTSLKSYAHKCIKRAFEWNKFKVNYMITKERSREREKERGKERDVVWKQHPRLFCWEWELGKKRDIVGERCYFVQICI